MSVLDFPRIHFSGACMLHEPTGSSNVLGNLDLTKNKIYDANGVEIAPEFSPIDFYKYYAELGERFGKNGLPDENGIFNRSAGRDYEGNSRVLWKVKVSGCQLDRHLITDDALIGQDVMLWGDYNEYLSTTFNQPKVVELDPSSQWTRQIFGGHLTIGQFGRSNTSANVFNGKSNEVHHARWHKVQHYIDLPPHWNNDEIGRADLFQMAIPSAQIIEWNNHIQSACLEAFIQALGAPDNTGVVIQFILFNACNPLAPNVPTHYSLYGTMGLWKAQTEMATYPAGRIFIPLRSGNPINYAEKLGPLSIQVSQDGISLNAMLAFPFQGRAEVAIDGPLHDPGQTFVETDLFLLSKTQPNPLAKIPAREFRNPLFLEKSGIIDVPWASETTPASIEAIENQGLYLVIVDDQGEFHPVFEEKEWIIQSESANVYLEISSHQHDLYFDEQLLIRTFYRGKPKALENIAAQFIHNPANHPFGNPGFSLDDIIKASVLMETQTNNGFTSQGLVFSSDSSGTAMLTLRGGSPGAGRLVFLATEIEKAEYQARCLLDDFAVFDEKGAFCSNANMIHVKVLPGDWHLYDLPESAVDFQFMYREVLQYYELLYPFMNKEVFSLASKAKTETYSLLSWQMVDPLNRSKSTYMPPTRELSYPKAMIFKKYLMASAQLGYVPKAVCPMSAI